MDNDADLDLVMTNGTDPVDGSYFPEWDRGRLWRNDGGNDGDWLRVRVVGTTGMLDGHGAVLRVRATPDGSEQLRVIGASTHFLGQSENIAHFGLGPGPGPAIDRLTVTFPSTGETRTYRNVPRRALVVVTEGGCADDNPCTEETLLAGGGCTNVPADALCDDGLLCNGAETCSVDAGCQNGTPLDCSGLDQACLEGRCDEDTAGCVAAPINDGGLCDDGRFCTVGDRCSGGLCAGDARDCSDGAACTTDHCDESAGTCIWTPDHAACDDSNACTDDACLAGTGCLNTANDTPCDDGLFCTVGDICSDGACTGSPRDCSDGATCTIDSCDETAGACVQTPSDQVCDDGLYCNGTETCDAALDCLAGASPDCSPLDGACVDGTCDETTDACIASPARQGLGCDDGAFCTAGDTCTAGLCVGTPRDCADAVGCSIDACDEEADVCRHVADDTACDDGAFCNGAETCDPEAGCVAGTAPCFDLDCGLLCNEDEDRCDAVTGPACDDDNTCTVGEHCDGAGHCVAG